MGLGPPAGFDVRTQPPENIAPLVVYLCTDEAADINGYNFFVGGGTVSLMSDPEPVRTIFKEGIWTVDELCEIIPATLAAGLVNPSPPAPPKS